jgi:glucosamine-6-phosphate deaminase
VIATEFAAEIDIDPDAIDGPNGEAADVAAECARYDAAIAASGGVDVQLLGIGSDGHIGFNEPGSSLVSRTRVKTLTRRTREDNARFFHSADEVPHHVVTQGLGTILEARHLVLVALGEGKADALAASVEGPLAASCPASVIQMHPHVTVVVDEGAASALGSSDYYRYALSEKPTWQHF